MCVHSEYLQAYTAGYPYNCTLASLPQEHLCSPVAVHLLDYVLRLPFIAEKFHNNYSYYFRLMFTNK